jgi:hypothetical protein
MQVIVDETTYRRGTRKTDGNTAHRNPGSVAPRVGGLLSGAVVFRGVIGDLLGFLYRLVVLPVKLVLLPLKILSFVLSLVVYGTILLLVGAVVFVFVL